MRADLAARGWSAHRDLGRRLAWVDAIALIDEIISDPSTWTGADVMGLDYPASWPEIGVIYTIGPEGFPKPLDGISNREKRMKAEREAMERRESWRRLSPVFRDVIERADGNGIRQ